MRASERPATIKLLLLTRSLEVGGAERQLVNLARALDHRGLEVHVATFYAGGPLAEETKAAGNVALHELHKESRGGLPALGWRLRRLLQAHNFQAIYSFQRGPNILSLVGRTLKRRPLIVWGIRFSYIDLRRYGRMARWADRMEGWLSPIPDRVIVNSRPGIERCLGVGFPAGKLVYIPNGIDPRRYAPQPCARAEVRRELGLTENTPLIGIVARIDPVKDHRNFLEAASRLRRRIPAAHFLCLGGVLAGMESLHAQLLDFTRASGLEDVVHWLGHRPDIARWMSALDIATLSSVGEGFPNAVAEAMACGVPCVVTNVGDSARVVGGNGWVVPAGDPVALAEAWETALALPEQHRREIGCRARRRIAGKFSVDRMADATLEVLQKS